MPTIDITCPACGFTQSVPAEKIPPRPVNANCPECRHRFPFSAHLEPPPAPPARDEFDFEAELPPLVGTETFATGGLPPLPPTTAPRVPLSAPPLPPEIPPPPPQQPAPADDTAAPEYRRIPFVFTGRASEYFGIWIVNLLLKIVTLGIYTAWAKVRKRRYFYGNTLLDGNPFDYTADPLAIFRGWCIGAGIFLLYTLGSQVSPILGGILGLLFFLVIPWLIVRSRIFNARNSAHRNIRFTFAPNYREAYVVFVGLPLLLLPTLGLITPYLVYRQKKFFVDNSGYGTIPFTLTATVKDFYRFFLKSGLLFLGLIAVIGIASALLGSPFEDGEGFNAAAGVMVFAFILLYFIGFVYFQTALTNLTVNSTRLGNETWLISELRTRDMLWLYFSSAVAILCSFGLLMPWAAVRLARYRCEHTAVDMPVDLRSLAAADQNSVGAAGDEISDIFDVNVDIGI